MGCGVTCIAFVRTNHAGKFSGTLVGGTGHQRGDGSRESATSIRVISQSGRHQQGAEVGVTNTELAELAGGVANGFGWEVSKADGDVHRGDDEFHSLGEGRRVKGVVVLEELQQVQRGQVAGRVVQAHVLRAGVGRGDSP